MNYQEHLAKLRFFPCSKGKMAYLDEGEGSEEIPHIILQNAYIA